MPGVHIDRRRSLLVGVIAAALVVVVALTIAGYRALTSSPGMPIVLYTDLIGDGIDTGTAVRLNGVRIGEVTDIAPAGYGTQRIGLRLDRTKLHGLSTGLRIDYAPANLFGISEIDLRRGPGGAPLQAGAQIHLTGPRAADVYDATMGNLLRTMSQVSTTVLTAQLSTLIARLATDLRAFTPFMQTAIELARTVADNQRIPPSELLAQIGDALGPTASLVDATISVIDRINNIQVMRTDRDRINVGLDLVMHKLFPTLTTTLFYAGNQFSGYTNMLAPMLDVLAQMVPSPQQSGAQLGQVVQRLRSAMPDTPAGPELNLDVDLSGVPGVAVPLLGAGKGGRR